MDNIAQYIQQRLSLREPLQESLDILVQLAAHLSFSKEADLATELAKVHQLYPSCTDFQRAFPSLAFSIATGVGKTRLMGAMIAYLHLKKGIRNFFVLAPNLTIYDKLIQDMGNPAYPKYVFNGIAEFVHNRPVIITGDNYAQQGALFGEQEIRINIFNISKFNSDNKGTQKEGVSLAPRIKRLSEYLGQSYWEYLTGLDDLVILMDEAHRYHADSSAQAINELKPVLGLELTATPFDNKEKPFKNVVYEYSLAQALSEGKYVKHPAIARRKDFQRGQISDRELEIIKLEDAVSIHKDTKQELELYALNENQKLLKPFILVVCKDTTHAKEIADLVGSEEFYEGEFKGKVLQIDSTTKKDGGIEEQFLKLEEAQNPIEIVIHVNMLKEGWDVTNLYTIVPLRAANASVLIEQTIGRGLRLPFEGKRTSIDKLDKLTIVAHENFDAVIEAAQNPNSILNKFQFIELSETDIQQKSEVVTSLPVLTAKLLAEEKRVNDIADVVQKEAAQRSIDAKRAILDVLPNLKFGPGVNRADDANKEESKRKALRKIEENLSKGQLNVFASQILQEAEAIYEKTVEEFKHNVIEIPRIVLDQNQAKLVFESFDLDTSEMTYQALDQEIIRMNLKDQRIDTLQAKSSGHYGDPIELIINEVLNYDDISYDENAQLLYRLATQAFDALKSNLKRAEEISQVVFQFKTAIAGKIYLQMKRHSRLEVYETISEIRPFVKIESWNFSALVTDGYRDYRASVSPTSLIPKLIFRGFEKACHFEYKFDSKAEQDMAFVLENDKSVIKWLRPAPNQFLIYWEHSKKYEPDFVAETADTIYMLETKMSTQIDTPEVKAKKAKAEQYCERASQYTLANGGKRWKYCLIPHDAIDRTNSLAFLTAQFVTP